MRGVADGYPLRGYDCQVNGGIVLREAATVGLSFACTNGGGDKPGCHTKSSVKLNCGEVFRDGKTPSTGDTD